MTSCQCCELNIACLKNLSACCNSPLGRFEILFYVGILSLVFFYTRTCVKPVDYYPFHWN